MPEIGTKLTGTTGQWQTVSGSTDNAQGIFSFVASDSGLLTKLGMWARRAGSNNAKPQLAIYTAPATIGGQGAPLQLLGYTDILTVSSGSSSGGALYEGSLIWSRQDASLGVIGAAVRLVAGVRYALVIHNENAGVDIAIPAGYASRLTFRANPANGNPPDPFPSFTQATIIPGALYGTYTPSTPPVATTTGPAASITTSTPTLTATITDAESGAPTYDRLAGGFIQVRQVGQTELLWYVSFTATSAERIASAISRVYTGPALTAGSYEWRVIAKDDTDVLGDWSAWHQFTIANLGNVVVTAATPTGKSESGVIDQWVAQWTSPTALAANGTAVRILSGGVMVRQSAMITLSPTVANNGTITLLDTAALLTRGTNGPLPSGSYTWQMQARDTGGGISPWSDAVAFSVNFQPNMPTSLRPLSGTQGAALPLLDWLLSDPDADDVLGADLISEWEITRIATGGILTGTTANVDPATGRGYFNVADNPSAMPAVGDYQWRVRGRDQSAVAAGTGLGGWSAPTLFTYIAAPLVTITAPTENQILQTSSPQIAWTVASGTQTFYQVEVFLPNETDPFFGSGQIAASSGTSGLYSIPAGVLTNGLTYDVAVTITTAEGVISTSPKRRFLVQYPTAETVNNVQASLLLLEADYEPNSVVISWGITGYSTLEFAGYIVSRRRAAEDAGDAVVIAHIKQAGQTSFIDYHAPPNVPLIYAVSQLRRVLSDVRQGPITEATINNDDPVLAGKVPLTVPMIVSLLSGADLRSPVIMLNEDYGEGFAREETTVASWGTQGKPTLVRSPEGYGQRLFAVGFRIRTDTRGTVQQHMTRWRDIVRSGHPVSIRTETEIAFCHIVPEQDWLSRSSRRGAYEVSLALEEVFWNEAVAIRT